MISSNIKQISNGKLKFKFKRSNKKVNIIKSQLPNCYKQEINIRYYGLFMESRINTWSFLNFCFSRVETIMFFELLKCVGWEKTDDMFILETQKDFIRKSFKLIEDCALVSLEVSRNRKKTGMVIKFQI